MKKFVVQAFQQKSYLPSRVKEKSENYFKHVQKMGKHLATVKIMKKAISRKQNQHLSTAQKFVISFVYNFIWKRISNSFVDLITPSIVKTNQLTKITDYRNHVGFFEGAELLLKTCKINNEHNLNNGVSKSVQTPSFYLKENRIKNNENLVVSLTKEAAIPSLCDSKPQQEDVNTEHELTNPKYYKTNDLSPYVSQLKTNFSSPLVNNNSPYSSECLDNERSNSVKVHNIRKIKDKNGKNFSRYHSEKKSKGLPKASKSNQAMDINHSPIKTRLPTNNKKSKKSNKRRRSLDGKRTNKGVEGKLEFEDNSNSMKAGKSLKIKANRNNELHVGLKENEYKSNTQAFSLDQKQVHKNLRKTNLKQDNPQENVYSFIEKDDNFEDMTHNKSKIVLKQDTENGTQILNKSYSKSVVETNQDEEEDSNLSKLHNETSCLQNELVKTNKAPLQSKTDRSYKKKKRNSKLKKGVLLTQKTREFEPVSKKEKITISEEYELENKKSSVTKTNLSIINNKENSISKYRKEPNQNLVGLTDDLSKTSETFKTNLVVLDTTQDEAQFLVTEQGVGNETKSNLINLNRVITKESLSHKKIKSPIRNNDSNNSEAESVKTVTKNLKPGTTKPWKRNKDVPAKRIKTKNQNINSKKCVDSSTSTPSQKHDNNLETKKIDLNLPERISPKSSFSNPNISSDKKTNKSPLTKTLSSSNVQNQEQKLPPKKTTSMESVIKVSLPTTNQMPQIKDKNSLSTKEHISKTVSKNYSKEEIKNEAPLKINNKPLVNTTATEVYKTNTVDGNELKNKNSKTVSVEQKVDIAKKQVKEDSKDNTDRTKNLEYQNELIRAVSNKKVNLTPKESNTNVVSNTKITNTTPSAVEKDLKKEIKLEKQTQFQDSRTSVASSKPKMNNLGKNEPLAVSNNNTGLEYHAHVSDKNKTKDLATLKNPVSLNSKNPLKPTNKTNLEYTSNDLLLTKTVADINQGLNQISGKEEFKSKMNQLLHNFTVTGQKQQATSVLQRRIKSQEVVTTKHEKEKKSNKIKESDVIDKSISNEDLYVKLSNHKSLNTKSNLAKNKTNNTKTTETNNVSANNSVKENVLIKKANTKPPTVSVRPAFGVPKDRKLRENTQTMSNPKTTTIVSSPKVKTVISNNSEPKNAGTTNHKEVNPPVLADGNLKNKEVDKKVVRSTGPAKHVNNNLSKQNDMLRKLVKRRPSD